MVVLDERPGDAALAILVGVERLEEEAARVAMDVRLDDDDPGEAALEELHRAPVPSSMSCSRYWPYSLWRIERAMRSTSSAPMNPRL